MTWRLFDAKLTSEAMLKLCYLDHWRTNSGKFEIVACKNATNLSRLQSVKYGNAVILHTWENPCWLICISTWIFLHVHGLSCENPFCLWHHSLTLLLSMSQRNPCSHRGLVFVRELVIKLYYGSPLYSRDFIKRYYDIFVFILSQGHSIA